jgi:hypothetical protein
VVLAERGEKRLTGDPKISALGVGLQHDCGPSFLHPPSSTCHILANSMLSTDNSSIDFPTRRLMKLPQLLVLAFTSSHDHLSASTPTPLSTSPIQSRIPPLE